MIIPEKHVATKLLCYLNPNRFNDQKNSSAVELLHRICFANLTDFGNSEHIKDMVLTDEERNIVLDNKWNSSANLEVKAKCNDVLSRFESDKRNITTLEKKRQLFPTLGSILPRLEEVFKEEFFFEINSFLQGEIDVNFRNNLLHGLLTFFEVDKYGVYLWWICLKLYFYEESCDKNMFGNILT